MCGRVNGNGRPEALSFVAVLAGEQLGGMQKFHSRAKEPGIWCIDYDQGCLCTFALVYKEDHFKIQAHYCTGVISCAELYWSS